MVNKVHIVCHRFEGSWDYMKVKPEEHSTQKIHFSIRFSHGLGVFQRDVHATAILHHLGMLRGDTCISYQERFIYCFSFRCSIMNKL